HRVGSKSFASQANLTVNSRGSNAVIGPPAERPSIRRSQLVVTPLASGVTAPRPVITTLRRRLAPINPPDSLSCRRRGALARDDHEATRAQRQPGGENHVGFVDECPESIASGA